MSCLKPSLDTFETNDNYWDCDCEVNYIHKIKKSDCSLCGALEIDRPPSRQTEINGFIKEEINYKSISNLNPIPKNKWNVGAMYLAITTEYDGHDGGVLIYGELTGDYDDEPLVLTRELDSNDSLGLFCKLLVEMPVLDDVNL